ncbi:MAG: hypothetical protein Q6373_005465 [Candidatus Sigynarchaeota archaeon]
MVRLQKLFWLNITTIVAFVLYAIGIYIQVAFQGITWGNVAVNLALHVLGNELGTATVVAVGAFVMTLLYRLPKLHVADVFLCWFWILSLYQCAANSFLQFASLPDEPVNQFFKILFPAAWYPVKEIAFIVASIGLTILWACKVVKRQFQRHEVFLIVVLSSVMIVTTALSQVMFLNP